MNTAEAKRAPKGIKKFGKKDINVIRIEENLGASDQAICMIIIVIEKNGGFL